MRSAALIAILLVASTAAEAAEKRQPALNFNMPPQPAYKDLPGVKTPEQIELERSNDGFSCTTALRTTRFSNPGDGFSRSLPERVYRCEKNGVVLESINPPARGAWMPGINPPDARVRP